MTAPEIVGHHTNRVPEAGRVHIAPPVPSSSAERRPRFEPVTTRPPDTAGRNWIRATTPVPGPVVQTEPPVPSSNACNAPSSDAAKMCPPSVTGETSAKDPIGAADWHTDDPVTASNARTEPSCEPA